MYNKNQLENFFYQGAFSRIEEIYVSKEFDSNDERDVALISMSLSRLGKPDEGLSVWKSFSQKHQKTQRVYEVFFYALIDYARKGDTDYAKTLLKDLIRETRSNIGHKHVGQFYLHQGIAFLRYFERRFDKAIISAKLATEMALKTENTYLIYLANDLLGHSIVKAGNLAKGLDRLKTALKFAEQSNSQRAVNAESISIAVYQSEYGLSPKNTISKLKKCLEFNCEDSYTYSKVNLELGFQLVLRGKFNEAEDYLNKAEFFIDKKDNTSHRILLHIYRGYLHLFCAEFDRVKENLNDIESLSRFAPLDADGALKFETLHNCYFLYSGEDPARLASLSDENNKILIMFNRCMNQDFSVLEMIEETGYSSFYLLLFRVVIKGKTIVLNATPKRTLFADKKEIRVSKVSFNDTQKSLLSRVLAKPVTKSEIIESHWGYRYRSERHDVLIYPVISKIRSNLGSWAGLIKYEDGTYKASQPAHMVDVGKVDCHQFEGAVVEMPQVELNFRQITLLRNLKYEDFINSQDYQQQFKISRATATRDLTELKQLGYLQSFGKARAMQYARNKGV